jgi:hypothetical protein
LPRNTSRCAMNPSTSSIRGAENGKHTRRPQRGSHECALNVPANASACYSCPSSTLLSLVVGSCPIVTYAHSVYAHSVVATACAVNVPANASARPTSSRITPAPGSRPVVAYAHSVFATFCALSVPATASAVQLRAPASSSHTPTACLPRLRVERARQRLRSPLQHPHQSSSGLPIHRRLAGMPREYRHVPPEPP